MQLSGLLVNGRIGAVLQKQRFDKKKKKITAAAQKLLRHNTFLFKKFDIFCKEK